MMRGIEEWNRHPTGTGEWSFRRNPDAIKAYWRDGAERMAARRSRASSRSACAATATSSLPDGDGIDLMSSIIDTQRQILRDTGLIGAPQVQTLYKEVQRYWDRGYRPPDDVTVVFCDDNWGNMRKLPDASLPARSGGYGMYYHFDYVGGGRNYKWVDTVNLTNTWEQLNLAYRSGVDRLWMVNVGDLKNEEQPTQFFLDYAWKPRPAERGWASGSGDTPRRTSARPSPPAIAEVLERLRPPPVAAQARAAQPADHLRPRHLRDHLRRPGEPVQPHRLRRDGPGHRRVAGLAARAEQIKARVPAAWQDAYFQLGLLPGQGHREPVRAAAAEFTNIRYAGQGRAATNDLADVAEARFAEDQALNAYYNTELAGGKWKDWQLQPKIGYGNVARYGPNAPWQQPEKDHVALPDEIYPYLKRIEVPAAAEMGVDLDGGDPVTAAGVQPVPGAAARSTSRCTTRARRRSRTGSPRPCRGCGSPGRRAGRQAGPGHRRGSTGAGRRRAPPPCRSP